MRQGTDGVCIADEARHRRCASRMRQGTDGVCIADEARRVGSCSPQAAQGAERAHLASSVCVCVCACAASAWPALVPKTAVHWGTPRGLNRATVPPTRPGVNFNLQATWG